MNLVPGVDVAFAMGYGLVGGAKKGATAGLGVGLGVFFHIALTALGVGALLVAYEGSLYLLRLFGAAYLIYLGLITWQRAPNTRGSFNISDPMSTTQAFLCGALVNLLNPKPIFLSWPFCRNLLTLNGDQLQYKYLCWGRFSPQLGL
ncbi:MAG: LysE family translocator [Paracoccaceae bacterium]